MNRGKSASLTGPNEYNVNAPLAVQRGCRVEFWRKIESPYLVHESYSERQANDQASHWRGRGSYDDRVGRRRVCNPQTASEVPTLVKLASARQRGKQHAVGKRDDRVVEIEAQEGVEKGIALLGRKGLDPLDDELTKGREQARSVVDLRRMCWKEEQGPGNDSQTGTDLDEDVSGGSKIEVVERGQGGEVAVGLGQQSQEGCEWWGEERAEPRGGQREERREEAREGAQKGSPAVSAAPSSFG